MPGPDGPYIGDPNLQILNLFVAIMEHPGWLLAIVALGCTIAVLARRNILAAAAFYCLAAFGLLCLIASPFIVPDDGGRAAWIIVAVLIYAGAALGPRLFSRPQ